MKKVTAKYRLQETWSVLKAELNYIFHDWGVMLILFGAILIYATAYAFAYKPEVLRNVPVAVVDQSRTTTSREMIRIMDATPNLDVSFRPSSLEEAKMLFLKRDVYGIIYIPNDFEKKIDTNEKAYFGVYADAGYFLLYKQVFMDAAAAMLEMNHRIEMQRFLLSGLPEEQARAVSEPVLTTPRYLFNPYGGYGTFVMPAILVLILQQTLLIGIGMVGGTWRERRLYRQLVPPDRSKMTALPIVLGKAGAYLGISLLTCGYVFGIHYKLFGYPMRASFFEVLGFVLPYILAVIFLGITLASLFRQRENSIITLLFTSIPLLMISGISVPREAMPVWLYEVGKIFPSSPGINGFVRLQTMGASLAEVRAELLNLWILVGVYFLTACIGMRGVARREVNGS